MSENNSIFSTITTFIFDFDGVMTDGTVFCDFEGRPLRATNVKDGYAIQLASKLGYNVAVISGAVCPSTLVRMNSLGVTDVFTGIPDKVLKLNEYMQEKGLKPEEIVFMGDDIPDLRVMRCVGLPACPACLFSLRLVISFVISLFLVTTSDANKTLPLLSVTHRPMFVLPGSIPIMQLSTLASGVS